MTKFRIASILIFAICLKFSEGSDICGVSDINPESLIANGRKPTEKDWPWIARIYINDKYFAGGSIGNFFLFEVTGRVNKFILIFFLIYSVSENVVIIPAHFIQSKGSKELKNKTQLSVSVSNDLNKRLPISHYIMHPDWNPFSDSYGADIAILFLKEKLIFFQTLRPICLPSESSKINLATKKLLISPERKSGSFLGTYKILKLTVIENRECARSNLQISKKLGIRSFCTEFSLNSPCLGTSIFAIYLFSREISYFSFDLLGDSGYLVAEKISNHWTMIGFVSATQLAYEICKKPRFIVYTEVAKFVSWIKENVDIKVERLKFANNRFQEISGNHFGIDYI